MQLNSMCYAKYLRCTMLETSKSYFITGNTGSSNAMDPCCDVYREKNLPPTGACVVDLTRNALAKLFTSVLLQLAADGGQIDVISHI